jgi:hypothetical protein
MRDSAEGGISLCGFLFVIFLILKLTHVIKWSWWWVSCPLWIGPAIFAVALLMIGIVSLGIGIRIGNVQNATSFRPNRRISKEEVP